MGRMGRNRVYIATSQDGYIADADGKVYLLDTFPMPENYDMRFSEFMGRADAILMEDKVIISDKVGHSFRSKVGQ